ncbi:MAG TPA: PKD domain-containing protein [Candidatus Paceibacterota bacterium]|nr:PKD domain-containing protein [Candidatus Paceibacterota bacterium]
MSILKKLLVTIAVVAVGVFSFSNTATAQTVQKKFLIDLGAESVMTPSWNNLTNGSVGAKIANLVDSTGVSSGIGLTVTDSFWQGWVGAYNGNGTTQSSLYPSSATSDSLFVGNHLGTLDDTAKLRFSGLNQSATYTLRLFGSRMTDDQTSDRKTVFIVNGQSKELQTKNNTSNVAEFTGLTASSGTLDLAVTLKTGSIYGYLGVIELIETATTTTPPPSTYTITASTGTPVITLPTNSVLLQSTSNAPGVGTWSQVSGPNTAVISTPTTAWTTVTGLIQGSYVFRMTVRDYAGVVLGSADVSVTVNGNGTPPPSNVAPTANAGIDQIITLPTSSVTLTGSGADSDGSISSYAWTKVSGGAATIGTPTAAVTSITSLAEGAYTFRLTVTDNGGLTASDDVNVTVNAAPTPPPTGTGLAYKYYSYVPATAWVTPPQLPNLDTLTPVTTGTVTKVDITPRLAEDTFAFRYEGALSVPTTGQYTFYLYSDDGSKLWIDGTLVLDHDGAHWAWERAATPVTLAAGTHSVKVEYYEGYGAQALMLSWQGPGIAKQEVPASAYSSTTTPPPPAENQPPTVNAGSDQIITLPTASVSLGATASDPNGDAMTYTWTKVSGGSATITSPSALATTVTGLAQGSYVFRFTATDSKGASAFDEVNVTVNGTVNSAPIVNAGTDQVITLPTSSVTLSATASDPNGDAMVYSWTNVYGGTATITTSNALATTVTGLVQGGYTFRLTATDSKGATTADDVVVTVNAAPAVGLPPVVNAGTDLNVPEQTNSVNLTQSVSDPEGKTVTSSWAQVSGPSTAGLYWQQWGVAAAYNLVKGTYVFRLTGTDADGASATDDVTVTVSASTGAGSPFMRTVAQKSVVSNSKTIYYYESLPKGYNTDTTRKWPLIIYHHGIGERGSTLQSLPAILNQFPIGTSNLEYTVNGVNDSFIVMVPQLHETYSSWQNFFTQAMIDAAKSGLRVDTNRIYLVGWSLGGFQTWNFPQGSDTNAAQIAAIAPVAGGSSGPSLCKIATNKIGVWAFHAVDDSTVSVSTTDMAINNLNLCNPAPSPTPKYTRYTSGNHWIIGWVTDPNAPSGSNLYQWLLTQSKTITTNTPPTANAGSDAIITLPTNSLTLSGSGTDTGGSISAYSWTKVSGGSATISTPAAASTAITGLVQGSYTFRLTVTDNGGLTASDDVNVTVNAAVTGLNPAARTLTTRMTSLPYLYNTPVGFYESLPRGYNNDTNRKWPLMIFLHGIGERGNGTTELPKLLSGNAVGSKIAAGEQLEYNVNGINDSFVVMMPQLSTSASDWHPYHVRGMIDYAVANYRVDPKRIYITGLSLGGFGTTAYPEFSTAFANQIAAVAPTDGANYGTSIWTPDLGSITYNTCNLVAAGVKVWQFYGADDTSWGWTAANFINRLNACNPAPNPAPLVTVYPGVGHWAWGNTYDTTHNIQNPNVYEWLLAQKRP